MHTTSGAETRLAKRPQSDFVGVKCYHVGSMLPCGGRMLSCGINLIMWGLNVIMWGRMLSCEMKCYHVG